MKKLLKLVATAVCLLAVSQISYTAEPVYGAESAVETITIGTVTVNSFLTLRESAATSATSLASLSNNTQVIVISKNTANWYNVTYEGQTGWVSGQYLSVKTITDTSETSVETVPSEAADTKTVGTVTASSALNLRESADAISAILLSIPNNAQVTVISRNANNWYNVTYEGQTGWVSGSYLSVKTDVATAPAPVKSVSRSVSSELAEHALSLKGVPYVFGGTSRSGFDCSGFIQYVFKESGISLPRTSFEQYKVGSSVSRDKLQSGDLVFFSTYAKGASHVGIYIGGGSFVDASDVGVGSSKLDNTYYSSRYLGARRVH